MGTTSTTSLSLQRLEIGEQRAYFDPVQLKEMKRWLVRDGITFIEGQDSLYLLKTKQKYINKAVCVYWPTLEGEVILLTPGEIARIELERSFGRPKNWVKKELFPLLDVSPPHYYDGRVYEDCELWYCDLSGAYWQVYQYLTLDCVWPRGLGSMWLYPLAQKLKDFKLARNAIVGISRSHKTNMWYKGEADTKPFYNPWFNPAIWRLVQSVLHEIAYEAILMGCCYVATDGYIFTEYEPFSQFCDYLTENGFTYKSQWGEGYLTGWSSYKVGDKQTKMKRYGKMLTLDNIMNERGSVRWLKKIRKRSLMQSITDDA